MPAWVDGLHVHFSQETSVGSPHARVYSLFVRSWGWPPVAPDLERCSTDEIASRFEGARGVSSTR